MLEDNVSTKRGNKGLTVKEMKDFLENLPEDAYLVFPYIDHSYQEVDHASFTIALRESSGFLTEFHDDERTPEPEYGVKENVVVIE